MEMLVGRFGVERRRVAVAGYADNAPADSNDNAVRTSPRGCGHPQPVGTVGRTSSGREAIPGDGCEIGRSAPKLVVGTFTGRTVHLHI